MENIEIKARYAKLDKARQIAQKIGATFSGVLEQVDTYFQVAHGRLKLREINDDTAHLIFYHRANETGPKSSMYEIYPVDDAQGMITILQSALGIWKRVEKRRELLLYEEVRIHLDDVKTLGTFIEFEGVLAPGSDRRSTRQKVEKLISAFGIQESQLMPHSYSDLVE